MIVVAAQRRNDFRSVKAEVGAMLAANLTRKFHVGHGRNRLATYPLAKLTLQLGSVVSTLHGARMGFFGWHAHSPGRSGRTIYRAAIDRAIAASKEGCNAL